MNMPESYEDALRRGCALLSEGRTEAAINAFQSALEQSPHGEIALCNLGIGLMQLGRRKAAAQATQAYLKIQPGDAKAWLRLGILLHEEGHPGEARKALRRAILLQRHDALAWKELGVCYLEEGREADGIEALNYALKLKPNFTAACCALGQHYERVGDLNAAIQIYRLGLHNVPGEESSPLHARLGLIYARQGETDLARFSLEEAIARGEADPQVAYELGRVYMRLNEPVLAQRQWIILDSIGSDLAPRLLRLIDRRSNKKP